MKDKKFFIYNTATKRKEEFVPVNDPVGMYCCGPTVYNYAHIGNLRTYIFEDVLKRALLTLGYRVKHVMNITDVGHLTSDEDTGEDKMEKGAKREGKTVWEIAEFFTHAFIEDIKELNILSPDVQPKATDHIFDMIEMIKKLEEKGFTYRTSDGIYFDTSKFSDYIKFAELDPENLRAGERVDMGEKRHVTDFALWKFSPTFPKRQMEWESPWGIGFPGWHIECSAMALAYLPQPIDIHCGGTDHIRVHHTNEIAQTEAATGKPFVKYWLHGEFLVLDKGKMSKSKDEFIRLSTVKERGIEPLAYRMFCYTAHYRSPLNFSWEGLEAAQQSLNNLRRRIARIKKEAEGAKCNEEEITKTLEEFFSAVCDDLNMPRAMAALWEVIENESLSSVLRLNATERADEILGLKLLTYPEKKEIVIIGNDGKQTIFEVEEDSISQETIQQLSNLLTERRCARQRREYQKSDAIRKEMEAKGLIIKDRVDGTTSVTIPRGFHLLQN
ncbi:MAG: cysteine--tRNA ligase [Chitinispirillaceae bacterium]|nr:cysteine--tRNA ligase [Chitinispirillaceae bacterium]